jgi:hypothetical protein
MRARKVLKEVLDAKKELGQKIEKGRGYQKLLLLICRQQQLPFLFEGL